MLLLPLPGIFHLTVPAQGPPDEELLTQDVHKNTIQPEPGRRIAAQTVEYEFQFVNGWIVGWRGL